MDFATKVKLNNGIEMPTLGLGVFKLKNGGEVENAVKTALLNGYRNIDTAASYHNEKGVGIGIKASGVPREEIFITSKVDNNDQGFESTIAGFHKSLKKLQTNYLDLYLIHWPKGKKSLETWRAMEELYKNGLVRAIGVCNFQIHHLEYLLSECQIVPAVNQVEVHPEFTRPELHNFCREHNIQIEAWSPLMQGSAIKIQQIKALAVKYNRAPSQIILNWHLRNGRIVIPKSKNPDRIISNADIYNFQMEKNDLKIIDNLNKNRSLNPYKERISYLLEMISKQKQNKTLFILLFKALMNRVKRDLTTPVFEKANSKFETIKD